MIRGALRFIGRVIQPSLMRRLVLAQMAVVAALWTLIVGLLFYDSYCLLYTSPSPRDS